METPTQSAHGVFPHVKLTMGAVLPVISLAMALFSLYTSEKARGDVERGDLLKTEYGLFHDLAQQELQNPMMQHLFASTGEGYDLSVAGVRSALAAPTDQQRGLFLLQERALAVFIFTTYEEAFYLSQQAEGRDSRRRQLALEDLDYFNDMFCNNPRLLWYWDAEHGGKLAREFATDLQTYYAKHVTKDCPTTKDPSGPFGK